MPTVNLYKAKTQLSKLVDDAARGEEVIIARAGRPVARLVAFRERPAPRRPGVWKGKIRVARDFDDLPPEIAAAFRGDEP